jgi:hypothetical protein
MVYCSHMASLSKEVQEAVILDQDQFVWETLSYKKYNRTKSWYFAMAMAAILFVAYAVITANFLFAFIVILTVILLLLLGSREPRPILVQVGMDGLVWDGSLHLYEDIDDFAIVYNPPVAKTLYVNFRSAARPRLAIQLEDVDPVDLRAFLGQFVREDGDLRGEPISDIVGRLLKL